VRCVPYARNLWQQKRHGDLAAVQAQLYIRNRYISYVATKYELHLGHIRSEKINHKIIKILIPKYYHFTIFRSKGTFKSTYTMECLCESLRCPQSHMKSVLLMLICKCNSPKIVPIMRHTIRFIFLIETLSYIS